MSKLDLAFPYIVLLSLLACFAWMGYDAGKKSSYEAGFAAGAASVHCPDGPGIISASVRWITPEGDTLYQKIWPDTTGQVLTGLPRPRLVVVHSTPDTIP